MAGVVAHVLVVHAAYASGLNLDAKVCSGMRIRNIHHRVWVGNACPPVQDLVSLVAAALLLKPDEINYVATHSFWATAGCTDVAQCHHAFNVGHRTLNVADEADAFAAATTHFQLRKKMTQKQCTTSERKCFRKEHMSDFMRLFVVNEQGGYYLDADSFVVDAQLHARYATCPFVMFSDFSNSGGATNGEQTAKFGHVNNGMFMGRPNSTFGAAWWRYFAHWDGSLWSDHSCGWPGRRARMHPDEVHVAPVMLVPSPFAPTSATQKGKRNVDPRRKLLTPIDVDGAAAGGASLVHLTNWKVRPTNVTRPVLLNVLDRAVEAHGGIPGLPRAKRNCVTKLRSQLLRSSEQASKHYHTTQHGVRGPH
eukprot:Transcript_8266.p1 GENE.Transcript_8266~~Transcript_8266.p1  ORF type:complete len:365 (-),score=40.70 Transcript_8266:141-1235(-)